MDAHVIDSNSKEISISISNTDIGILYIIQHELLKLPTTNFAGVIVKHPLTNECWMRIASSKKPIDEINKATDLAIKASEEFKKLLCSEIKVN